MGDSPGQDERDDGNKGRGYLPMGEAGRKTHLGLHSYGVGGGAIRYMGNAY